MLAELFKPRPQRLSTYLIVIAFSFAFLLVVLLFVYSYYDNEKTVNLEVSKNANHNLKMVEAIFENRFSALDSVLQTAMLQISGDVDQTVQQPQQKIYNHLLSTYDGETPGSVDLLFFTQNDGNVIDVSSPFFNPQQLIPVIQQRLNSATEQDSLLVTTTHPHSVLLAKKKRISSPRTGKIIGTAFAATMINDNIALLKEVKEKTTSEFISLLWQDKSLIGNFPAGVQHDEGPAPTSLATLWHQNNDYFDLDDHITINGKQTSLILCQKMSSDLLIHLNTLIIHRILFIFLATLISAGGFIFLFHHIAKRSLHSVLSLTESAFNNPEPSTFDPTLVTEFNILGNSIVDLDKTRKESQRQLLLSSSVFDNAAEGIVITNLDGNIEQVNPACELMSGFSKEELIGENPRIFKSHHHDQDFYKNMWESLIEQGHWDGEVWNRRKDGDVYPLQVSISSCWNSSGNPTHYVAIFHDITDIKKSEEQLQHQAYHDALTNLPNRKLFYDRLGVATAHARHHKTKLAVVYLDIDNFKNINDSLGHHVGDQLLQKMAQRIKNSTREEDTTARIGGDEFIILMPEIDKAKDATILCQRILNQLTEPISLAGKEYFINISMGITIFPDDGTSPEDLVKNADIAMYRVKETGKNGYQLYTRQMQESIMKRLVLESNLSDALHKGEFILYYQPQVVIDSNQTVGAEALIRWQRPNGEIISPFEFIPIAEECGLIGLIDDWVLLTACKQGTIWRQETGKDLKISINLSTSQFHQHKKLVDKVRSVLDETGFPPELLTLEITENAVMADTTNAIHVMHHLTDLGVSIAIDDFGTGYSSLSYVKNFPASYLKIDRSFIKDIPQDSDDMAIAASIVTLAKNLRMEVIAEGVETEEQLNFLRGEGCQQVQGYYFGKPYDAATFKQWFLS